MSKVPGFIHFWKEGLFLPPLVIPAKAGIQEKVEKKRPSRINWKKIFLFQKLDWIPAFAGMTNWENASGHITSNSRYEYSKVPQ